MLGGALMFGALRRIWQKPTWLDATGLGIGVVILANSRPAEGFLAAVPVAAVLLRWIFSTKPPVSQKLVIVGLPVCLVGFAGAVFMTCYNLATTQDPCTLPYQLHDRSYSASSLIIWKTPPEIPRYNHERMEKLFVGNGRSRQLALREPSAYISNLHRKFYLLSDFFPLGLGLGLLAIPWALRDSWLRFALVVLGLILLIHSQLATSWMFPHYLAPFAALFYAVNAQGLRRLFVWQRHNQLGKLLTRAILIALILKLGLTFLEWTKPTRIHQRQQVVDWLSPEGADKHLVIVSYPVNHSPHDEYVYNAADIDNASIVWARDMGPEKNERLMQYFSDRKVWRWVPSHDDTGCDESVPRQADVLPTTGLNITHLNAPRPDCKSHLLESQQP
jgi:hypothetical protein